MMSTRPTVLVLALILLVGLTGPSAMAQSGTVPSDTGPAGADTSRGPGDYVVYTSDGTPMSLDRVISALDTVDVVFIGETHDDPTAHALQDSLLRRVEQAADTAGRPIALSLEMFERDVQPIVDEYLSGHIAERHFIDDARAWQNYRSAYRPLVERARAGGYPVLAANAPRRYVNRVAREGPAALETLSAWARDWIAPLPYPGPSDAYRDKWRTLMRRAMPEDHGGASPDSANASSHGTPEDQEAAHPHGAGNGGASTMLQAQALWDATMAHTIARHLLRRPGTIVVHLTGGFHVSRGTGTPEALRHYRPSARSLVVMIRPAADPSRFEPEQHEGLGDVVILTEEGKVPSRTRGE
jgi:uncharacterized iron-regulated protein